MTAMTLISRTAPSVRCEDWGRNRPVKQVPIAQWTAAELAAIPGLEDAMIAGWPKTIPRRFATAAARHQAARGLGGVDECRALVLGALTDRRVTARQIAQQVKMSESYVYRHLGVLLEQGLAARQLAGRRPDGGPKPATWTIAPKPKGEFTESRILAVLDIPKARFQILDAIEILPSTMDKALARLRKSGRIVKHGEVPGAGGFPVATWVRV